MKRRAELRPLLFCGGKMRFIRVPNRIFSFRLSAKSFRAFIVLLSKANVFGTTVISYAEIASACGISSRTAYTAINELVSKELIARQNRYNTLGYAKNQYTVRQLPGGWFRVGMEIARGSLRNADFQVYCYIRKCMDRKGEAFPSLNRIAEVTGISHSRVAVSVRYLRQYSYLNRVRRHYRRTKAFCHNRYLLFNFDRKRRVHSSQRTLQKVKSSNPQSFISPAILKRRDKFVKHFFRQGSPDFAKQLLDPQSLRLRKNNIYTLSKVCYTDREGVRYFLKGSRISGFFFN